MFGAAWSTPKAPFVLGTEATRRESVKSPARASDRSAANMLQGRCAAFIQIHCPGRQPQGSARRRVHAERRRILPRPRPAGAGRSGRRHRIPARHDRPVPAGFLRGARGPDRRDRRRRNAPVCGAAPCRALGPAARRQPGPARLPHRREPRLHARGHRDRPRGALYRGSPLACCRPASSGAARRRYARSP